MPSTLLVSLPIWKPLGLLQFMRRLFSACFSSSRCSPALSHPQTIPMEQGGQKTCLLFSHRLSGVSLLFSLLTLPFGKNSLRKVGSLLHSPEEPPTLSPFDTTRSGVQDQQGLQSSSPLDSISSPLWLQSSPFFWNQWQKGCLEQSPFTDIGKHVTRCPLDMMAFHQAAVETSKRLLLLSAVNCVWLVSWFHSQEAVYYLSVKVLRGYVQPQRTLKKYRALWAVKEQDRDN